MVRTYKEVVNWIHNRLSFGVKPGLKRMEWMMEKLGHPQRRIKAIHVGGTNGKGSTVCFLRHILQEAGYRVGTFTSPYVEQFNERISINGQPIRDVDLMKLVQVIQPLAEELEQTELGGPTEFEVITAMALYYFGKVNVQDVVIFEVGLGGRLDSTNVIYPLLSVITNVGYDHIHILGNTLEQIAFEKAGIIKAGIPVVTAIDQPEAVRVVEEKAVSVRSKVYALGRDFTVFAHEPTSDGERFSLQTPFTTYHDVTTAMFGGHQVKNAALALMAADYLRTYYSFLIEREHMYNGVRKAEWLGRFEKMNDRPLIIIDGAHNEEGIDSLVATMNAHYPNHRVHVLFTALGDKPVTAMIRKLETIAHTLTFTTFDFPRALSAEQLAEQATHPNVQCTNDWKQWLKEKRTQVEKDDIILITGSLYFISNVRNFIKNKYK
ncbi:bifunctional folylpolyglutamate synthase/dihydrofolate synthase [Anoxybacillus ayderensis]|uniref:bifunctional folylpolyglutamate synthase/dihydrofolate synthase n=1 Tax=Anoxybacillus ayderensis TaxID=265546 RepID=UPI002E1F1249|nr:bifunctional folylpolyglutamate synthase/dihydrofolate synthase [Anoxybacillus ayderensis]